MSENLNDVSMFDTIERISGLRPATTSCQRIEAVRASAEQAQLLNLSLGEPLLYLNAYFHDQYDHPLCIGRQYYIGSRYMFEFLRAAFVPPRASFHPEKTSCRSKENCW